MDWRKHTFRDPQEARKYLSDLNIKPTEAAQAMTALCNMQRDRIKEMEKDLIRAKQFDDSDSVKQTERELQDNIRRFKMLSALRTLAVQADAQAFAAEFAEQFSGSDETEEPKPTQAE